MQQIKFYGEYVVTEENQGADCCTRATRVIRYNDFSQIARFGDDMGMISMWGAGTGNVWEYNACHDGTNTSGWEHWLHVLFNDDGSHQAALRGNIIYWITGGGRSRAIMSKGNDQLNLYNIIADCDLSAAATIEPFVCASHDMVWSNNIVAAQIGMLYEGGIGTQMAVGKPQPILKEAEKNLYFYQAAGSQRAVRGRARQNIKNQVAGRNQAADGIDKNSVYADPLFDRKRPWWDCPLHRLPAEAGFPGAEAGLQADRHGQDRTPERLPVRSRENPRPPGRQDPAGGGLLPHLQEPHHQPAGQVAAAVRPWTRIPGSATTAWISATANTSNSRRCLEWVPPARRSRTTSDGKTINASGTGRCLVLRSRIGRSARSTPRPGRKGPELFDVAFAPGEGRRKP